MRKRRRKEDGGRGVGAVPATQPQRARAVSATVLPPPSPLSLRFALLLALFLNFIIDGNSRTAATASSSMGHGQVEEEAPLVETKLGKLRGTNQNFDGHTVHAFLGVPYAQRPTGTLRFAAPQMVEPWEGELEANSLARTCFYPIDTMFPDFPGAEMWNPPNELDEDCLAMNIWVPDQHDGTVMVWIYGGGFYSGSPSLDLYDGRVLAVHERTIVVNINYRLGAFGFLYLGDGSGVPGNMGLLDQQLALLWIHQHIDAFGGDPQRVTLFGESAGGASAAAHLFAPDSHCLFARLIAKSGAIVNNWATKPRAVIRDISLHLARRLNCSDPLAALDPFRRRASRGAMERVVACLSRVPAPIIQRESDHISESLLLPMNFAFVPIDEDELFFKGNLFDKLRRKEFKKDVSIMLGTVRDEGTYWLPYYLHKYGFGFNHTISPEDQFNQALVTETEYTKAFDAFLPYFGNSQLVRHALMHAYARITPAGDHHTHAQAVERWRDGVARFLGDYFFTCAIIEFADIVSENIFGSVFMYYFTKRSSANPWPRWMGIMHGYELEYVFGMPMRHPQQYDPREFDDERAFAAKVMELWGRFAHTGEPIEYWPKYNRITRKSLVLSDEIARGNSHRIYVDVHGKLCRLLEEAQAVARLAPGQRQARLSAREPAGTEGAVEMAAMSIWQRSPFQQQSSSSGSGPGPTHSALIIMISTMAFLLITYHFHR